MKCTGSKTWQRHNGKWAENMGGDPAKTPFPPGPPLVYPEKSINWTGLDGSHRRAMRHPCEGWEVFHLQTGFGPQKSIKMGQWRQRGGTQSLLVSCEWLSGANCYAYFFTVPGNYSSAFHFVWRPWSRERDMISMSHHRGEICKHLVESSQKSSSLQNMPCSCSIRLLTIPSAASLLS